MTQAINVGMGGGSAQVQLIEVLSASGHTLTVQGSAEEQFYNQQREKYQNENAFTMISDLQDLDRLLSLELITYRAQHHLAAGQNYYGDLLHASEEAALQRTIKENTPLISTLKSDLGLTKSQRDKAQYESVGTYIKELLVRAKEHGVKREEELTKAIKLVKELFAIIGAFDRADEIEREKIGFRDEAEVLDWVRTMMQPEFDRIDEHFRENQQRYWVRRL